jgi:hypothetical protein
VPEFYRERRSQPLELALAVAEPALSITLVTTLVSGIAAFISALAPVVRLTGLPALATLTAVIAYFYGRRLEWSGMILREWIVLLAPVLVLWRVVTLLTQGSSLITTLGQLRAGRSAIHFVRQEDVGEDGAGAEDELGAVRIVHLHARHIVGQQVRRELHAFECGAERGGQGTRQHRFPDPRHILKQDMALA